MFSNLTKQMNGRPTIISIEGNIGVGKSTILEHLRIQFKMTCIKAVFMPEPVDIWNTVCDENGQTILSKYYENPVAYAFSFQMMAYTTRLSLLRKTIEQNPDCDIIVCERSLEADRNIFAKMLLDDGMIEYVNYQVYQLLYDDTAHNYGVDAIIYMRADPSKCLERIQKRQRNGESSIPLDYLAKCDTYYQNWIGNSGIAEIAAQYQLTTDNCKDYVYWTEETRDKHVCAVLYLDTNADVDYTGGSDQTINVWTNQIMDFIQNREMFECHMYMTNHFNEL